MTPIALTPYNDEEIEEREFRLEYGILQPEFWRELNEWRQRALEDQPWPASCIEKIP